MTPHDEQRLGNLLADFVSGCNFERPFHLVVIDSVGSVAVTRYDHDGSVEQVCHGPGHALRLTMISPLTVTCISPTGCGRSARIEIEHRATMQ